MAIEQGLVMLIQQGLAAATPPVVVPGGFATELPKDMLSPTNPMAWSYRTITSEPSYHLGGQDGFTSLHVQIDCHGYDLPNVGGAANAQKLARAIDAVLRGLFTGTLPDTDQTFVFGITRQPGFVDGFSDVNRSYVRSLEYQVDYNQV